MQGLRRVGERGETRCEQAQRHVLGPFGSPVLGEGDRLWNLRAIPAAITRRSFDFFPVRVLPPVVVNRLYHFVRQPSFLSAGPSRYLTNLSRHLTNEPMTPSWCHRDTMSPRWEGCLTTLPMGRVPYQCEGRKVPLLSCWGRVGKALDQVLAGVLAGASQGRPGSRNRADTLSRRTVTQTFSDFFSGR